MKRLEYLAEEYIEARRARDEAVDRLSELRDAIAELLPSGGEVLLTGGASVSVAPSTRCRLDVKALRAAEPEVADRFLVVTESYVLKVSGSQ